VPLVIRKRSGEFVPTFVQTPLLENVTGSPEGTAFAATENAVLYVAVAGA
jgi:hypothetical protein